MGRFIAIFVVLVIIVGAVYGSYAWIKGQQPAEADWKLIEVTKGAITEKALAIGQIEPRHSFHIKSKISGIVDTVFVEVGDAVRAGDPLFEIAPDPTPTELVQAERALESAASAHAHAKSEYERYRELVSQGILAQEKLDGEQETLEQARIALERARDNLALIREGRIMERGNEVESIIRSPAAGIVLARPVNSGDPIVPLTSYQAGTEMATIANMGDLVFKGTVDEIDVGKLSLGMLARLKVGALPDEAVKGRLARIAPQATEREGAKLFEVEIELEATPSLTLRAGYSATGELIIREKTEIALIPERLVTFSDDGKQASVELPPSVPGGEPRKVPIEVGLSDGLKVEVISGLEPGDKVVQRPPREIGS